MLSNLDATSWTRPLGACAAAAVVRLSRGSSPYESRLTV